MSMISGSCNPPRCVADALGLGFLDSGDDGVDVALFQNIYRHARGEDGQRVLITGDPSFTRGWIDLQSPRARNLITVFVALDDAEDIKHARRIAQSNIEAQPWNDLLGISYPPIQVRIKIHGMKWGLRFQSGVPAMRGQEQVNEQLPPIPGTVQKSAGTAINASFAPDTCVSLTTAVAPSNMPPPAAGLNAVAEALRKGGYPT
jgi:hypothetical protein